MPMKNWLKWLVGVVLVVGAGWWVYPVVKGWRNDIRMVVLAQEQAGLLAISPERRMVNLVVISGETEVWIPGGLGWYKLDQVDKLLKQEKREDLWSGVMFYNFGFLTDKIARVTKLEDWEKDRVLIETLGWKDWGKLRLTLGEMLPRTEDFSDEVAVRDLSDSRLANEEVRLAIINSSNEVGIANFISERLTWAGLMVIDVDKGEVAAEGCRVSAGSDFKKTESFRILREVLGCSLETADKSEVVEVYLGEKWAKMLNYSSHVGTF